MLTRLNRDSPYTVLLIYLFLITSLFGCFYTSAEASPTYISSPRPAPVSGPAHSALLWKISGAQPSWIYATLRTADPRAAIPPARILSALRLSHSYHPDIELSAGIEIALAGKLMLDGQPDLPTRLPPATWDRALAAADQIGLPEILLHRMSPGVAALAFANPPGLDVNESMDARLRDAALAAGLPITPLETLDEHLADFDALPELGARALLTQVLGQTRVGLPARRHPRRSVRGRRRKHAGPPARRRVSALPGRHRAHCASAIYSQRSPRRAHQRATPPRRRIHFRRRRQPRRSEKCASTPRGPRLENQSSALTPSSRIQFLNTRRFAGIRVSARRRDPGERHARRISMSSHSPGTPASRRQPIYKGKTSHGTSSRPGEKSRPCYVLGRTHASSPADREIQSKLCRQADAGFIRRPPHHRCKCRVRPASVGPMARTPHFCHVRFLCRFDFKRLRRLCLFIFRRRFFFRLPMVQLVRVNLRRRVAL